MKRNIVSDPKGEEKLGIKKYFEKVTPCETVGIFFALLTVINSIMMLAGADVPKEGVFAYVHLMSRLGIITLIVTLISFREIIAPLYFAIFLIHYCFLKRFSFSGMVVRT
ncbi:hypothetical protein [Candidatus Contubernalis alkaliaceticus]|uniref:hypothetical protein n=1 Tax=Candidatus Contubernalis alkaliaceticus TaxID=338645 RepID=UPI001F4BF115|nr:hypothetical protein [Candidatus Contubernalis alkalaceticus]UNC92045.1 hypothetical protein HUE98_08010 [Candidatus Contubernalis alkalaceticus]